MSFYLSYYFKGLWIDGQTFGLPLVPTLSSLLLSTSFPQIPGWLAPSWKQTGVFAENDLATNCAMEREIVTYLILWHFTFSLFHILGWKIWAFGSGNDGGTE
jgi:hypothetical protein